MMSDEWLDENGWSLGLFGILLIKQCVENSMSLQLLEFLFIVIMFLISKWTL